MKKSSFVAMLLGTVSGVLFALGICMVLIEEWNSSRPGVVLGAAGVVLGIVTVLVWRRMEHCRPVRISLKSVLAVAVAVIGALALGIGMCFSMVWGQMIPGIVIGLIGILLLILLIPLTKGIRD